MTRLLIFVTAFSFTASALRAQTSSSTLTLDEAVARGLTASHRLSEIEARQDAARAIQAQRRAAELPQASVQAGYMRTNHVEEFGIPGGRLIYPDIPDNFRSRLDLQWPIYSGGRTAALTRAAAAEADALALDRETARADLELEIARAYWAVVTARTSAAVVEQALGRIGAHLADVRNQLDVGLVPPSDVLSLEAQQSRQQMLLIEARNLADTTAAEFRRLIGMDPETPFELADSIDAPPSPPQQVRALVDAARASRPERRALEIRIGAMGERIAAAEAGRLPTIATVAGYDAARPNARIFPREAAWKPSWDVSVNVTWPLFDGGRARGEVAEAAANRRAAEERLKEFDAAVEVEVRQRAADLASTEAAIEAAEAGVRSAAEARRVITERFSAGVATNTDVIDAQVALLQAELDRTRARANAHLAASRLERALGR
jgi:outer membrane protein TolC